jgi:dihydrolipoamide dehydrogenase
MPDYDLIVVGGGAAGLTAAGIGAQLGAKTLLIEQNKLGGECLYTGCVPSKALLRSARVASLLRRAREFGINVSEAKVDFAQVMDRVARVISHIEPHDSPERMARYGVETRFGTARFASARDLDLNGERLTSRRFIISTGSRPAIPPIEGLSDCLTNETLFQIRRRPEHLVILGAGAVGVEMAQAFARLGSRVTLLEAAGRILPKEDEEVSAEAARLLERDGVRVLAGAGVQKVSANGGGETPEYVLLVQHRAAAQSITADALLVAAGRRPGIDGLALENAGVRFTRQGITINSRCRTSVPGIYACGDVTGHYQFTHMAEHQAKIAVANAILHLPLRLDYRAVPWSIFTDPEIACVGMTEKEAHDRHGDVKVYRARFDGEDRAIADGETDGFVKVVASRTGKRVLGAHIVGPHAGELIMEYVLAMRHGISLPKLSSTIHPYPTLSLAGRHAADAYWTERSTPNLARWVQRLFGYSGPIAERYRG